MQFTLKANGRTRTSAKNIARRGVQPGLGLVRFLIALIAALLATSPSYATVFDVTGITGLSGTVTIDTVAGTVTAADLKYVNSPPDYTNVFLQEQLTFNTYEADVANGTTSPSDLIRLLIFDSGIPIGSLKGYNGGGLGAAFDTCELVSTFDCSSINPLAANGATITPASTPLPAALPLFATGLGAMGLFGWRRKRKAEAIAA
jgi:hypothetical protein